jgi:hypothetical protein
MVRSPKTQHLDSFYQLIEGRAKIIKGHQLRERREI